jgi:molecular chaperone GrpE (heat shock protein)
MKAEELQQENNALKAQIMGLSETLKASDGKIKFLETELQDLFKRYLDLKAELDHYIMLTNTANKNQNDSRYY